MDTKLQQSVKRIKDSLARLNAIDAEQQRLKGVEVCNSVESRKRTLSRQEIQTLARLEYEWYGSAEHDKYSHEIGT